MEKLGIFKTIQARSATAMPCHHRPHIPGINVVLELLSFQSVFEVEAASGLIFFAASRQRHGSSAVHPD
jgi:hypothetical protein